MSAEIKMPAVTTPPIVIKVGGKCYSLQGEGKLGKPNNSLSNIQWSGITCAACQAAGNVPAVCPCNADWGTYPCGDIAAITDSYTASVSGWYAEGVTPTYAALGDPAWDGAFGADLPAGNKCWWYANTSVQKITSTDITKPYKLTSGELVLVASSYWLLHLKSGDANGYWTKNYGLNPAGTYTLAAFDASFTIGVYTFINKTRTPTSIGVS